jgi:hypothetical protein
MGAFPEPLQERLLEHEHPAALSNQESPSRTALRPSRRRARWSVSTKWRRAVRTRPATIERQHGEHGDRRRAR